MIGVWMKLGIVLLCAAAGCTSRAVKPPTPAPITPLVRPESLLMAREGDWFSAHPKAVVVIDGQIAEWTVWRALKPDAIARQVVLEPADALARYGPRAAGGALEVITKEAMSRAP